MLLQAVTFSSLLTYTCSSDTLIISAKLSVYTMNFTFLLPCHLFGNYFTISDVEVPNLKLISVFPM